MKRHHVLALLVIAGLGGVLASPVQAQKAKAPKPMVHVVRTAKVGDKQEDKQDDKQAKEARKAEERAEKEAKDALKDQPGALLHHVKLSGAEKRQVKAIEKKYAEQEKALEKQEDAAEKSGTPTADEAQKIDALRDQERDEIRAVLTPAQQAQFDGNAQKLGTKH